MCHAIEFAAVAAASAFPVTSFIEECEIDAPLGAGEISANLTTPSAFVPLIQCWFHDDWFTTDLLAARLGESMDLWGPDAAPHVPYLIAGELLARFAHVPGQHAGGIQLRASPVTPGLWRLMPA